MLYEPLDNNPVIHFYCVCYSESDDMTEYSVFCTGVARSEEYSDYFPSKYPHGLTPDIVWAERKDGSVYCWKNLFNNRKETTISAREFFMLKMQAVQI